MVHAFFFPAGASAAPDLEAVDGDGLALEDRNTRRRTGVFSTVTRVFSFVCIIQASGRAVASGVDDTGTLARREGALK
jgi:hypothetical protein